MHDPQLRAIHEREIRIDAIDHGPDIVSDHSGKVVDGLRLSECAGQPGETIDEISAIAVRDTSVHRAAMHRAIVDVDHELPGSAAGRTHAPSKFRVFDRKRLLTMRTRNDHESLAFSNNSTASVESLVGVEGFAEDDAFRTDVELADLGLMGTGAGLQYEERTLDLRFAANVLQHHDVVGDV